MNEWEMESDIYNRLLGFPVMPIRQLSIGCNMRIIDIAMIAQDDIITFELKLTDWRQALVQASEHCRVADFAYVVMPGYKHVTRPMRAAFEQSTVGLCFYNHPRSEINIKGTLTTIHFPDDDSFPMRLIIPAQRNTDHWNYYKEDTKSAIYHRYQEECRIAHRRLSGAEMQATGGGE